MAPSLSHWRDRLKTQAASVHRPKLSQSSQNFLISRPDTVIHLHELPPDHALHIDDVGGRVGDLAASRVVGVEEPVPVDDLVIRVRKEGKPGGKPVLGRDLVHHPLQIFRTVHGKGENLGGLLLLFRQQRFQLHELLGAVGSPVTPVED